MNSVCVMREMDKSAEKITRFIHVQMVISEFEQSMLMAELSSSKTIIWPADILTSITALFVDEELPKKQTPIHFLSRKSSKTCIIRMVV